jgi:hypothetical protein
MFGRRENGRFGATRVLLALVAAAACLGSVAYAAARPNGDRGGAEKARHPDRGQARQQPPQPRFIEVPPPLVVGGGHQFRFHVAPAPQRPGRALPRKPAAPASRWRRFQCRLDSGGWTDCSSPRVLDDLAPGDHSFAVRALSPRGKPGSVAHYRWSQLEPKEFTIEPRVGSLEELMPGAPPQRLPVRIGNPNPVSIEVTRLTVAVAPSPPGCPADPNFAVTPADLTPAAPLSVPAGESASLPAAAAPTLALRELPTDQNACQGAAVHLVFSGEARG